MTLKLKILSIVVLCTLFSFSLGNSQQTNETKTILILFALSPGIPAYRPILDDIRQKFSEEFDDSYILHMEYLEAENYPKGNYPKERFDIYNQKYRNIKLDLLVCIGRDAISPIKKNAESYLLNLPTISLDFDFSNYGYSTDLRLNEHTAVIGMRVNLDKTISTALSVFPATSSIYFIAGTAPFDKFMMSIANEAAKKIDKNKKNIFITDLSMDRILQQVHHLPDNSIIYVLSFSTDSKLVTYYNPEAIRLISISANSPVFSYSDAGFGEGAVGGYTLSFRKVSLLTAETAVKILKGADPNSFKVTEQDYYEYLFDWRELKRWNLVNSDLIPEGSTILFREINLIDKYKWVFGAVLLFLIIQSVLIASLIRLNRNQKLLTKKIIETENRYREFLHEDRSLRLGKLAASLSHELSQPLTAILSTAQAGINFINSNEANPELLKQILQKIIENDKRTASILSSLRGMMKLESKVKEKVNLNFLINEVTTVIQIEANKMNTELNVELKDNPVFIIADGIQIQQVLLNFILNALQSMEKVKTKNRVITISQVLNDEEVIVSVLDRGKGIDEAIKEKIFKPFITSKKEGTGIGLSICSSIIEDHQGEIWAENVPGGGAKFSFSLKIL